MDAHALSVFLTTGCLMVYIAAGFVVGILGGLFGVGGAEMLIPLLVYGFGFAQHKAQGTSLAMLLPPLGP